MVFWRILLKRNWGREIESLVIFLENLFRKYNPLMHEEVNDDAEDEKDDDESSDDDFRGF